MNIEVGHDPERLPLYVRLNAPLGSIVTTEDFGRDRYVNYDEAGEVVGIEFLALQKDGFDLDGLPEAHRVAEAIESIPSLVPAR